MYQEIVQLLLPWNSPDNSDAAPYPAAPAVICKTLGNYITAAYANVGLTTTRQIHMSILGFFPHIIPTRPLVTYITFWHRLVHVSGLAQTSIQGNVKVGNNNSIHKRLNPSVVAS